jgi:outer membrane receptor protein involved in Fe transport
LGGNLKGAWFAIGYQYMGKRNAVYANWSPPKNIFMPVYNLLDAAIGYTGRGYNISLNVYNVTNAKYMYEGYFLFWINEWSYIPGEPVNFKVSVEYKLFSKRK